MLKKGGSNIGAIFGSLEMILGITFEARSKRGEQEQALVEGRKRLKAGGVMLDTPDEGRLLDKGKMVRSNKQAVAAVVSSK